MKSLNRVFILGNLGHNPELHESRSGRPYSILRVATHRIRPREDGTYEETPEWHSVFVWGKLAETCARHLGKGSVLFIEGSLNHWQEGDGKLHKTAVTAENVHFVNIRRPGEVAVNLDNPESARNHDAVAHPA